MIDYRGEILGRKILILGASYVQADALTYLKQQGFETFSYAVIKKGPGVEIADHFEVIDILDSPAIANYVKLHHIDAVYSVGSDIAMPVASEISEKFILPHFVSSNTAQICNNKIKVRNLLGKDCEWNIPFQIIRDEKDIPAIPLPLVIKPADSQGQRGISLVHSMDAYQSAYQRAREYSRSGEVIIEKYVSGCELSVNAYLVYANIAFMAVSERETWPNYLGLVHRHILPFKGMTDERGQVIRRMVKTTCEKLGITDGPVYYQIKLEKDQLYLLEMTPRLDGCHLWQLIKHYTDVNLIKLTFDHLLKGDVSELDNEERHPGEYRLVFFGQKPGTRMDINNFVVPEDALEVLFYYQPGQIIRAINGHLEKVGYFIQRSKQSPS